MARCGVASLALGSTATSESRLGGGVAAGSLGGSHRSRLTLSVFSGATRPASSITLLPAMRPTSSREKHVTFRWPLPLSMSHFSSTTSLVASPCPFKRRRRYDRLSSPPSSSPLETSAASACCLRSMTVVFSVTSTSVVAPLYETSTVKRVELSSGAVSASPDDSFDWPLTYRIPLALISSGNAENAVSYNAASVTSVPFARSVKALRSSGKDSRRRARVSLAFTAMR
mmetsp:Transcript_9321/g.34893  ORF Transcript_9321/g.34893 Transcript_9321/m.34893 type:complete len:228 (-) Transcript_9321:3158-3841(-)